MQRNPQEPSLSQFNSKSFKKLKREWYDKLKASGFEELETEGEENDKAESVPFMKHWTCTKFRAANKELYQAKIDYFSHATEILNTHDFESDLEKEVWELHTEGFSYREIGIKLKDKKINKDKANEIVKCVILTFKNK